ncbi:histone chaperone [Chlamydoabsidia padenii]|nr:histone chaperone [Chlamydoabsidia padenii]
MSLVNILNVKVLDNPTHFNNDFNFQITFECNAELKDDLEWRMIYVGSAENPQQDQVLDSIMVGPVPVGVNTFVFSAPAPKLNLLPQSDLLEVTVVLLSCLYHEKEFVRIGYYVNNEYTDEELRENPPAQVIVEKLQRNILADKPKVTRYTINWTGEDNVQQTQPVDQDMMVQ